MARTTLTIDDAVLRQLKKMALEQGRTLQAVTNELLRRALATPAQPKRYTLELRGWEAEVQPGVDILDRDKLFDLMNGR
jgi:hypothetical protein